MWLHQLGRGAAAAGGARECAYFVPLRYDGMRCGAVRCGRAVRGKDSGWLQDGSGS